MSKYHLSSGQLAGIAGLLATLPMTAVLLASRKAFGSSGLKIQPKEVSENLLDKTDQESELSRSEKDALSWTAHFSFGAAAGATYPFFRKWLTALPFAARGPVFGLGIWAINYMGWLPLLGVRSSAPKASLQFNVSGILAHLVWGASVVGLYKTFCDLKASRS